MDSDAASKCRACGEEGRYSTIGHRAVDLCMEETLKEEGKRGLGNMSSQVQEILWIVPLWKTFSTSSI
jgi:hypothetical protein